MASKLTVSSFPSNAVVFMENTTTGRFSQILTSTGTLSASLTNAIAVIVPTATDKYCYWSSSSDHGELKVGSSTTQRPSTASSSGARATIRVIDQYGTHYGLPNGDNKCYQGTFVGVKHNTTTDSSKTFSGWKVYVDGNSAIGTSGSATSSKCILRSTGYTQSGNEYVFSDGYSDAVVVQQFTSNTTSRTLTFEAVYESSGPTTITVTFSGNGYGTPSSSSQSYTVGSSYGSLPTFSPSSPSYQFDGWYTASSGGSRITTSSTVSASYTTLYAHCSTKTTYHIYYDANGGSGAPSDTLFYSTGTVTLSSTQPTWTGNYKTFLGWSKSSTATTASYSAGGTISITSLANITLYAVWQSKTVTVTYSASPGTVSPSSQTKTVGEQYGDMPTPTRSGYGFIGWYTGSGGTGSKIESTTTVTNTSNHTLYAGWNRSFTITYNANGGTGAPDSQTVSAIGTVTVPSKQPTRNHATFLGWGTSSTTTVVSYRPLDTIRGSSLSGDLNLYAVWEFTTVTVTLSANGGNFPAEKGGTPTTTKSFTRKAWKDNYGEDLNTHPLRDGYYFVDWTYGNTVINSDTPVEVETSHTVNARWTSATSGKSIPTVSSTSGYTSPAGTLFVFVVAGGASDHGDITVSGLGEHIHVCSASDLYVVSSYAKYSDNDTRDYLVLNWNNSGTSSTSWNGYYVDVSMSVEGRTISCHADLPRGLASGLQIQQGYLYPTSSLSLAIKTTQTRRPYGWMLFAKSPAWSSGEHYQAYFTNMNKSKFKKGPVVTLNGGDFLRSEYCSETMSTLVVPLIEDISLLALLNPMGGIISSNQYFVRVYNGYAYGTLPTPTYSGYTFQGWYTSETGGSKVESSTIFSGNDNTTLYAHWSGGSPIPGTSHTLYYNANGGSVSPTYKTLPNGSAYGTLPTPTRSGYTFQGWFTDIYGGTQVSSSTTIGTDDVTIYAHWNDPKYTITFNPNGGSVSETSRTISVGSQMQGLPTPWKKDSTFDGWYTAASGGTKITESTIPTGNMTVYAHWNAGAYDLWGVVVS